VTAEAEEYLRLLAILADVCAGDLSAVGPRLALLARSAERTAAGRRSRKGGAGSGGGWGWGKLLCWWSDPVREALGCYADAVLHQGRHNLANRGSPQQAGLAHDPAASAAAGMSAAAVVAAVAAAAAEGADGVSAAIDAAQRGLKALGADGAASVDGAPPGPPAVAAGPSLAFGYDEARVRPCSGLLSQTC
jgi:hypothetical protein